MKTMDLTCPNCGAKMTVDRKDEEYITCAYCDSRFLREEKKEQKTEKKEESNIHYYFDESKPQKRKTPNQQQIEKTQQTTKQKNPLQGMVAFACIAAFILALATENGFFALIFLASLVGYFYLVLTSSKNSGYRLRLSRKNKWTALLLCFFFGIFGVHYFYVGRIGKGLLYIVTFGLFGIGYILDLFMILTGKFKDHTGATLA